MRLVAWERQATARPPPVTTTLLGHGTRRHGCTPAGHFHGRTRRAQPGCARRRTAEFVHPWGRVVPRCPDLATTLGARSPTQGGDMSSIGVRSGSSTGQEDQRADVELRLPADSAYASVLRTTTAGLAARLDFPIDDIEDLRIAVGEASAMVLPEATTGSDLTCHFFMRPGELTVSVGVGVEHEVVPDYDSFAWQVLT